MADDYREHIEGWVDKSNGKIRADVVHDKLVELGYTGCERTTRRIVAEIKTAWRLGHTRVHRPWVTEPGLWLQYDFGDGPVVAGRKVVLLVAWLAWCRYRVVLALHDRTAASVFAGLDRIFRIVGGAPTYVLTDNEKTVTTGHVAGVPVRNRAAVTFARYYGVSVLTCAPADPATKGGVENAVKLAKADIVPTETNLASEYDDFAAVEAACAAFTEHINARVHRATRRAPAEMLAAERRLLHAIPEMPHTASLGITRTVASKSPMVTFERCQYSVPADRLGQSVWVRRHDGSGEVVISALDAAGPVEIARHPIARPGSPAIDDAHFPGHEHAKVPGDYRVQARNDAEHAFLAIGAGAGLWLTEAAAVGAERIGQKMAHAVSLAALAGADQVDQALGAAAAHGRFATGDLDSILAAAGLDTRTHSATDARSLSQGTSSWARMGERSADPGDDSNDGGQEVVDA